jgi:DNA repair protein RadC
MLVTNPKGDQAAPPLSTEIMEVMHTMQQYMQHSETHLQKVEGTGKEIGVA